MIRLIVLKVVLVELDDKGGWGGVWERVILCLGVKGDGGSEGGGRLFDDKLGVKKLGIGGWKCEN